MNSRPYISQTADVYNEGTRSTVPATFGNQHLLLNQDQHRRIYDTTTTSLVGNQQQQMYNSDMFQFPQQIQGQKQIIPEGVTYTFNPLVQNYALRNFNDFGAQYQQQNLCQQPYQQPLTLEQHIAMNQLQKHALESMLLHQKIKENPFKLQFHNDCQTDTADLRSCCQSCKCTDHNLKTYRQPLLTHSLLAEADKLDVNQNVELKPNSFLPDSAKQKRLSLSNQETAELERKSTDTQCNLVVHCECKDKVYTSRESQTEMRRVTFDDKQVCKPRPKSTRSKRKKVARSVDDGSSESSSSSADSLENSTSKEPT